MTWATIIASIIQIFGPFLSDLVKKLIDKWFNKASTKLGATDPTTLAPDDAINMVFGEVEENLPRVAPARRLLLKIMKRVSLKHSAAIVSGQPVSLDAADVDELNLVGKIK